METRKISANALLLLSCLSLLTACKKSGPKTTDPEAAEFQQPNLNYTPGIRIAWDYSTMTKISRESGYNGYARMIRLADNSLICAYEFSQNIVVSKSTDDGVTWSAPMVVVAKSDNKGMTVPDILQLKDGSLLLSYNPRPYNIAAGRNFAIRTIKSYDGGATWKDDRSVYEASYTFENGCWEPSAIQLPGGEIQLFFSNEGVYLTTSEQNISVVRSNDGGLSWSGPQIASFRPGFRDGMPAPVLLKNGTLVFAIEDNGTGGDFKPSIIRNTLADNWSTPVGATSDKRTYALAQRLSDHLYAGAPYLRQLSGGDVIMSYQGTEGRTPSGSSPVNYSNMKFAIGTDDARSFDRQSEPFNIPDGKQGIWNSVSVLDDKTVVALTSTNGLNTGNNVEVWMIKGHVIPLLSALNQKITIDGRTDESAWSGSFPVFVGHKSLSNVKATMTYDNDNLYVLTKVTDKTVGSTGNEEGDGVTVYISTKEQTYSQPGAGVFRIYVGANNKVFVKEGRNGDWKDRDGAAVRSAVIAGAGTYGQEIAIPWAMLGGKPPLNSNIGFNLGLTENSGKSVADQKETIDACPEAKPNTWMTITIK